MPQNTTLITSDKSACSYDQFAFNSITGTDVIKCIRNFPTNKASGYDNISMLMIKKSATHIAPVLTKILNRSLQSWIFPACWKNAIVHPVYKKGDHGVMANYRSIAVLPAFSKIFEKLAQQQLTTFLSHEDLLSDKQHGFRCGHSYETALRRLTGLLADARRQKKNSVLVALDFSRAFDSLDIAVLLDVLITNHFGSLAIEWIKSYRTGCTQQTKYANTLSNPIQTTTGVPQGGLLSTILFNIYINCLLNKLPKNCAIAYADDVTLLCSSKNMADVFGDMQVLLNEICSWAI